MLSLFLSIAFLCKFRYHFCGALYSFFGKFFACRNAWTIQKESHQSKYNSRTLPFLQRRPSSHFKNTGLRSESLFASAAQREFHLLQENKWCVFCKSVYAARHRIIQSAPLRIVYISFNLFEYSRGTLSHTIFHCILLHLLNQYSFLVVLSRYLCKTTLYFANYYSGPFGPSFIVQNCIAVILRRCLYQSFPAPAQDTEILSPAHFPQAANRRLSLPKVSAAAALLQTVTAFVV